MIVRDWLAMVLVMVIASLVPASRAGAAEIFWTNAEEDRIEGAALDGSGAAVILDLGGTFGPGSYEPEGIDTNALWIFWVDEDQQGVFRANRDGSGALRLVDLPTVFGAGTYAPDDVAVGPTPSSGPTTPRTRSTPPVSTAARRR